MSDFRDDEQGRRTRRERILTDKERASDDIGSWLEGRGGLAFAVIAVLMVAALIWLMV